MFDSIIFDWSGTLCNDIDLSLEATNYVLEQYQVAPLTKAEFRAEFQLPYPDYYAWKVPAAPLDELENHYRHCFDTSTLRATALPGAQEFLEFCKRRGIRCFILTSMDPRAFDEQARDLGLHHYFEGIHSGIHNKEEYILTLMNQHQLSQTRTAFVGDMQHDIAAAHRGGIVGIGVLTGYNNAEQLSVAHPDIMVPNLFALQNLIERALPQPTDSIYLNGLELFCHIGVPEEERAAPQRIVANIKLESPIPFDAMAENIAHTIDYDTLSRRLSAVAQAKPTVLLETLSRKLARCCIEEFGASAVTVEVHKFILPQLKSTSVKTYLKR